MFKNDRMMTILTGLILAVFAGSMVQYGDRFMAMLSGESTTQTSDDFYSVRSGSSQLLDVLANDDLKGPIIVTSQPNCGSVALSGANQLQFSSDNSCSGQITFAYCVDSPEGCASNSVTLNVISLASTQVAAVEPQNTELVEDRLEGFQIDGNDSEEFAEGQSSDMQDAPVVVATVAPESQEEQAPALNNIIISMQPPTLVAPTIDEFVTPSVATASIRQQNIILENTAENIDTSINTQSSTETVAPVEFGVANFGAGLGDDTSNVLIGSASQNNQQAVLATTPQLTNITPQSNPVNAPLGREPVALAELPGGNDTSFGSFTAGDQNGTQFSASQNNDTFSSPVNDQPVAFARIDQDQSALEIERSGTTALIALQLSGTDLAGSNFDPANNQLPNSDNDSPSLQAPAPISLANTSQSEAAPIVLGQEPEALVLATIQANADTLLHSSQRDANVLLAAPFTLTVTWRPTDLPATLGADSAAAGHLTADIASLQVKTADLETSAPADINEDPELVLANLTVGQTDFSQQNLLSGLAPSFDISGNLPQVNKNVPGILSSNPVVTAPTTELASLDTGNVDQPESIAPTQQSTNCEIFLDPSVRTGANILLFLSAECKPNMAVTISHAGLEFTIMTAPDGSANVIIPALQRTAEITATFADGTSESTVALVTQIGEVTRTAVTWRGAADLDLHAFEYGAPSGSDGHIWAGSARDFRSARLRGGGYLVELGDSTIEGGAMAEVYTMPLGRTVERGSVAMKLELNNVAEVCGNSISARTLRTRSENSAGSRSIRFTVPGCAGSRLTSLSVPGAVDDIRLIASN